MAYFYLALAMCSSAALSVMSSLFGKKNAGLKNLTPLYSFLVVLFACVVWGIVCVCKAEFEIEVIGYSVLYGLFYAVAIIGMFQAYKVGSTSLTAFIKQLSLICVAFWGFLFWGNSFTRNIGIGLALIIVALVLCFFKDKKEKQAVVSWKWAVYALMLLCGNAGCSIVQKYQQRAFDGQYKNIFMLFGVLTSLLICVFVYFRKDRCKIKQLHKGSIVFPILGGISSALLNLLILLLMSSKLQEGIVFPGIAVGGLALTLLFSVVAYREKLKLQQWIGLAVGTVALVFLNL